MLHSFVEVSCEGADLKDLPETGLKIASLLLELHIALKTSVIPKFCFEIENRKKEEKKSCVSLIRNFVAVAAML